MIVGQYELRVSPFPARHGLRVLTRLTALVGPALARAADTSDVATVLAALVERLDVKTLDELIDEFASYTEVRDLEKKMAAGAWLKIAHEGLFDQVFAGRYAEVLAWLKACLEINFADFLASIGLNLRGKASPAPSS